MLPGGLKIKNAGIATAVEEHVSPHVVAGTAVRIVGGYGDNIMKSANDASYPWLPLLQEWTSKGATVEYLLIEPSDAAVSVLKNHPLQSSEQIQIRRVNAAATMPKDVVASVQKLKTFHFITLEQPSALWVEPAHLQGSDSTDVQWYAPENVGVVAAEKSLYHQIFNDLFQKYATNI